MEQAEFTNHLINESSPYLLQHAHNPVDWYPWGEEAFAKARQENKPVLLSIGYSACHWCHVMAHESFEDEDIAKLMNDLYVNIKVDREERPDLDQIYMNAVQMMTHHGGWPMTVFLTPDGVPFYGGTYFPPQDRYNMPGFPRVLISVAEAYRDKKDDIAETGTSLLNELRRLSEPSGTDHPIEKEMLDAAYVGMVRSYDSLNGGFGEGRLGNVDVLQKADGEFLFIDVSSRMLRPPPLSAVLVVNGTRMLEVERRETAAGTVSFRFFWLERNGARMALVGLKLLDRGVLRSHQKVVTAMGEGEVTSGPFSPTLPTSFGMARGPGGG